MLADWLIRGFCMGFSETVSGCCSRICRGYLHARLVSPAATPQSRHLPQAQLLVMSLTGNHFIWHQVTSDNLTLSDCTESVLSYVYRNMSVLLVMKTLNVPVTMRKVMIPEKKESFFHLPSNEIPYDWSPFNFLMHREMWYCLYFNTGNY